MDAYYASVELLRHPELRGAPLVIGGRRGLARLAEYSGRGVITTATYEARAFGLRSGMSLARAAGLCPQAVLLPADFDEYRRVSRLFKEAVARVAPLIEDRGIDEIFIDLSGFGGEVRETALAIKAAVREATGLSCSIGVAPNKLLAKLASEMDKPDGLTVIRAADAQAVLDPLPVGRLHGIGRKTAARLEEQGLFTLGQLRAAPEAVLWPLFGRDTRQMRDRAAGIDERPVVADAAEQQLSTEETFESDLTDREALHGHLAALADRTASRLRSKGLKAGLVFIKVRRRDFATFTRQRSFTPATQETRLIVGLAASLFEEWLDEHPRAALRLLGVGVGRLAPADQLDLFATPAPDDGSRLDAALDGIRGRFGEAAVRRGSSVD